MILPDSFIMGMFVAVIFILFCCAAIFWDIFLFESSDSCETDEGFNCYLFKTYATNDSFSNASILRIDCSDDDYGSENILCFKLVFEVTENAGFVLVSGFSL